MRIIVLIDLRGSPARPWSGDRAADSTVRSLFLDRARLLQDYDASRIGRFERHWIGFMLATQKPFGIGPLEFGYLFGEDTHNIWLKALFDYSWLGFAAYVTMTMVTLAAGFRILFRDRPWQPYPAVRLYRLSRPCRDRQCDRHRSLAALLPAAWNHLGLHRAGGAIRAEKGKRRNGRSGGIRTHDPLTPSQVRYRAALRSEPRKALIYRRYRGKR
jgi:hypothetical protein